MHTSNIHPTVGLWEEGGSHGARLFALRCGGASRLLAFMWKMGVGVILIVHTTTTLFILHSTTASANEASCPQLATATSMNIFTSSTLERSLIRGQRLSVGATVSPSPVHFYGSLLRVRFSRPLSPSILSNFASLYVLTAWSADGLIYKELHNMHI